jgi:hypothetical protein
MGQGRGTAVVPCSVPSDFISLLCEGRGRAAGRGIRFSLACPGTGDADGFLGSGPAGQNILPVHAVHAGTCLRCSARFPAPDSVAHSAGVSRRLLLINHRLGLDFCSKGSAVYGSDRRRPVIVGCVKLPLVDHDRMPFVPVASYIDVDNRHVLHNDGARPPAAVSIVRLMGRQGNPSDACAHMEPCHSSGIPGRADAQGGMNKLN